MTSGRDTARPLTQDEAAVLFEPLENARHVLAAVSGGADSVALLHLLAGWARARGGPILSAATVDHGLRPEGAGEAAVVAAMAARLGIDHAILIPAEPLPVSGVEEAAREARYALLEVCAQRWGADCLVTAHTLDDQAETVLMRLAAGSGPAGLAAMRPDLVRPAGLRHVRPLLDIAKARLKATVGAAGLSWSEDAMNADPRFARARLRSSAAVLRREGLTPVRLAMLARRMARIEAVLEQAVDAAWDAHAQAGPDRVVFASDAFAALPEEIGLRVLRRAISAMVRKAPIRLARLESLAAAVRTGIGAGASSARTLAGARVAYGRRFVTVTRAAPRRSGSQG